MTTTDLFPTKTRLGLLDDVAHHIVRHDVEADIYKAFTRDRGTVNVTARCHEAREAGWLTDEPRPLFVWAPLVCLTPAGALLWVARVSHPGGIAPARGQAPCGCRYVLLDMGWGHRSVCPLSVPVVIKSTSR